MADKRSSGGRRRDKKARPEAPTYETDHDLSIGAMGIMHRGNHEGTSSNLEVAAHERVHSDWYVSCPRFLAVLQRLGLHMIIMIETMFLDHHLLTALVERWSPRTNTFHLPTGEMTVTLQDVQMILGIRCDGPAFIREQMVGQGRRWPTWIHCCDELLGDHPIAGVTYADPSHPGITSMFTMGRSYTQLPLRWLRWTFQRHSYADMDAISLERHVRAYVLYILGTFLIPDLSGSHVYILYLTLLEDLDVFAQYSIGGAVLSCLYRELHLAVDPVRVNMGGCLHLLQLWSWERLYVGRPPSGVPVNVDINGKPLAYRWNQISRRQMPTTNVATYRDLLDRLGPEQVIWEPYLHGLIILLPDICTAGMEIWTSRVPVICWRRAEWTLPDRVMRQFGCIQSTEVAPIEPRFTRIDGRGKADLDWAQYYAREIELWNDRRSSIVDRIPHEGDGRREYKAYMRWYKSWATLSLLPPPVKPPTSYYPAAPEQRLSREFIGRVGAIAEPYAGGRGRDARLMQSDLQTIQELSYTLRNQLHLDPAEYVPADYQTSSPTYEFPRHSFHQTYDGASGSGMQRSQPDDRRHSTYIGSADYVQSTFPVSSYPGPSYPGPSYPGPSYQDPSYQWPSSSEFQPPTTFHQDAPSFQLGVEEEEDPSQEPERRSRRGPSRFTPGSDAIRRRTRRK